MKFTSLIYNKFKKTIKNLKPLYNIWKKYDWFITKRSIDRDIKIIPDKIYKGVFGKKINWDNPKCYIEKIYWMQLFTDTSLWSLCADKYKVREYVLGKGCGDVLNDLYGCWDNANFIDWEELPQNFILKTNNACGRQITIFDKKTKDKEKIFKKMNEWLDEKYGYRDAQFHYTKIKPRIIAEKLLVNTVDEAKSLIDYKFFCFDGIPEYIIVIYNKFDNKSKMSFYDLQWNNISERAIEKTSIRYGGLDIVRPISFDRMIQVSKKLATGFPHVRIDFYEVDNKPIFGEMTFTPGYGSLTRDFYDYFGSKIHLDKQKKVTTSLLPFS